MQRSQLRNYVLFFVASMLFAYGYAWLKLKLNPPPPAPTPEVAWTLEQQQQAAQIARWAAAATTGTPADLAALATEPALTRDALVQYARAAKPKPAPAPAPEPVVDVAKIAPVTLGGDGFQLRVKLTPLGGGVRQLVLNHFHQANHLGLPDDTHPEGLELIPEESPASFLLLHYGKPDADDPQPLDTLGRKVWDVTRQQLDGDRQEVAFTTDLPDQGVRITKTFSLGHGDYHVGLAVKLERLPDAKEVQPFRYQLTGGHGLPIEGEWYTTVFRNALVGWVDKQGATWRILEDARTLSHNGGSERYRRDDKIIRYAAVAIQYFASAIVVDDQQAEGQKDDFLEFVRATVESSPDPRKPFLDDVTVRAIAAPVDPKPGQPVEHRYLLYHGPVKVRLMSQLADPKAAVPDADQQRVDPALIDRYENALRLNSLTDYGRFGFWTSAIIFFTNVMHAILGTMHRLIPNYGLCIIGLTFLVRLMMFPLSRRQAATMARMQEKMAKVAPEMKKIEEKHKNDFLAKRQAQQELYARHGINPAAGLGGCLMLFVQMPVFMGLYFALQENFFFRLQPLFGWLPWIPNLAAPDMLVWWGERIPWISDPAAQGNFLYLGPYFNLLPVVAATLMIVQQKMTMPPPQDEQQEMQQKMTKYMMIVFGLMFYKVPAGLGLYFIVSSLWGLTERKLLPKKKAAAADAAAESEGAATGNGRAGSRGKKGKPTPQDAPPGKFRAWWEKVLKEASKK